MKCPKCPNKHRRSAGMICSCGYVFALDPKVEGIGDRRFLAFVNAASCNGTYAFTENQLYTAACRKQLTQPIGLLVALIVAAIALVAYMLFNGAWDVVPLVFLGLSCLAIFGWLYAHNFQSLPRTKFDDWLEKYQKQHGRVEGLVQEGKLTEPPAEAEEPDIYDYGVERVLITQRPVMVDLLVANNAHSTNRAVIVSSSGYPEYLASRVQKLLSESPELPVFLLHDATPEGAAWAQEQKDKHAGGDRPVTDLGMAPEAMKRIKKINTLRLSRTDYQAPLDALPMAMLMSGVALAMDQGIGMEELIAMGTSPDSTTSFG